MNDWMTELIGVPAKEYPAFMAGLSFLPSLDPDDALMALRCRGPRRLKVKLAGMRGAMKAARTAGLPRLFELEAEYEEQQLVAELKFVNGLVEEMAAGTLEGLDMWRTFHTEGFNPEEVHFTFDTESLRNDPGPRVDTTRPRAHTTTSSIHEGPAPEAALRSVGAPPSSGLTHQTPVQASHDDERRRAHARPDRGRRPHEDVREGPGPHRI